MKPLAHTLRRPMLTPRTPFIHCWSMSICSRSKDPAKATNHKSKSQKHTRSCRQDRFHHITPQNTKQYRSAFESNGHPHSKRYLRSKRTATHLYLPRYYLLYTANIIVVFPNPRSGTPSCTLTIQHISDPRTVQEQILQLEVVNMSSRFSVAITNR